MGGGGEDCKGVGLRGERDMHMHYATGILDGVGGQDRSDHWLKLHSSKWVVGYMTRDH